MSSPYRPDFVIAEPGRVRVAATCGWCQHEGDVEASQGVAVCPAWGARFAVDAALVPAPPLGLVRRRRSPAFAIFLVAAVIAPMLGLIWMPLAPVLAAMVVVALLVVQAGVE